MFGENLKPSAPISGFQASLETPVAGQKIYDQAIVFRGWVYAPGCAPGSICVRAYLNNHCCAETRVLFQRADLAKKLNLPPGTPTGFRMFGALQPAVLVSHDATLRVTASWDNERFTTIAEETVQLIPASLRERPYGDVVCPTNETLLHRENIYGSGPPIEEPGFEVSNLLAEYLPEGCSVVDVGCGAGAYGPGLMAAGHDWLGLEANAYCCDILLRRQLPFRRVHLESPGLPGADGEWDCAICIEVLEHVREPEIFVGEIARMIRNRALFSVPNMEVLPYLHDWGVVPWHLLEGDHKNFFTRSSLQRLLRSHFRNVEVFSYGEHPVKTRDEIPVNVHLFAVADK